MVDKGQGKQVKSYVGAVMGGVGKLVGVLGGWEYQVVWARGVKKNR